MLIIRSPSIRGKSLLGSCDGADLTKQALCLGKISGYADMLQALKMICLDNNVNRRQTVVVVLKFLSDHPEDIDKTAPSLALAALTKAFLAVPTLQRNNACSRSCCRVCPEAPIRVQPAQPSALSRSSSCHGGCPLHLRTRTPESRIVTSARP